jgi:adenylate kinase
LPVQTNHHAIQVDFISMGINSDAIQDQDTSDWTQTIAKLHEPGPLLLLGAPGVGKGTQADILARLWNLPQISTGEILRANVANGTALGLDAERIMMSGGLVPDRIMIELVADRLGLPDTIPGFVLDGFPRTVQQARWLDSYLRAYRNGSRLRVVNLQMSPGRLVDRVLYRKVCPVCNFAYNSLLRPPKNADHCDQDNAILVQRSDDSVEVLQARLEVFRRETESLIQYYRSCGSLIAVDAERPIVQVTKTIIFNLVGI